MFIFITLLEHDNVKTKKKSPAEDISQLTQQLHYCKKDIGTLTKLFLAQEKANKKLEKANKKLEKNKNELEVVADRLRNGEKGEYLNNRPKEEGMCRHSHLAVVIMNIVVTCENKCLNSIQFV